MSKTVSGTEYHETLQSLSSLDVGEVLFDEPLRDHCSWCIGGPAAVLVEPHSTEQAVAAVQFLRAKRVPMLVIGQGTNLLFDDAGLRGVVLKLGAKLSSIEIKNNRILAEAGVWVPRLARSAAQAGLAGLEHAIGIPGTLGGLVLMNGGSHRKGIGENVRRVWVVDNDGRQAVLSREDCNFSYRHSALQGRGMVVLRAELECEKGDPRQIRREMLCDLRERRQKFPRKEPNCGSVFLSTAEMHASVGPPGKIIEEAGLKGFRIGSAEVSPRHANFIVNRGGATSAEVLAVVAHVREVVLQRIGFDMRCEVRYVSPEGKIMPADRKVEGRK